MKFPIEFKPWRGVDLDGTLAHYDGWKGPTEIGEPVPAMLARVKKWLDDGEDVRILTARVFPHTVYESVSSLYIPDSPPDQRLVEAAQAAEAIREWCKKHLGRVLPITCRKDKSMVEIWDDRAVGVITNRGIPHETMPAFHLHRVLEAVGAKPRSGDEYARAADFVIGHIRRHDNETEKVREALNSAAALLDGATDALHYVACQHGSSDLMRARSLLERALKVLNDNKRGVSPFRANETN